ncbi:MAG: hypothetical protein R3E97_07765 [Candidatus Eisenbacteria bacterium]
MGGGIPGNCGWSHVGNAGAYGGEMARIVAEVEVFDPTKREVQTYANDECAFAYRTSRFKTDGTATAFVLGATLNLHAESPEAILGRMDAIRVRRKHQSDGPLLWVRLQEPAWRLRRPDRRVARPQGHRGGRRRDLVRSRQLHRQPGSGFGAGRLRPHRPRAKPRTEELGIDLELEVRLVGFGDEA